MDEICRSFEDHGPKNSRNGPLNFLFTGSRRALDLPPAEVPLLRRLAGRRWKFAWASFGICILSVMVWRANFTVGEATYKGKTAAEWFHSIDMTRISYKTPTPQNRSAFKALKAMKEDAVPEMLHELSADDLPYHYEICACLSRITHGQIQSVPQNVEQICYGFRALGPNAKDAVPELVEMSRESGPGSMSALVLNQIDPEAGPRAGLW